MSRLGKRSSLCMEEVLPFSHLLGIQWANVSTNLWYSRGHQSRWQLQPDDGGCRTDNPGNNGHPLLEVVRREHMHCTNSPHSIDMHWRDMQVIWCTYISLQREPQCMHICCIIDLATTDVYEGQLTEWQSAKVLRNHWMFDKLNTATWPILEGTFQAPWLQQWTPTMVVTLWPKKLTYLQHLLLPSKIQRLLERLEFLVQGNYIHEMMQNECKEFIIS